MKRLQGALAMAACMTVLGMMLTGCSSKAALDQTASSSTITSTKTASTNPYLQFDTNDPFGNRSISVFGDSITHGANAPFIPTQSYIGLFRQAVNDEVGGNNYGFTSLDNPLANDKGTYDEIHSVSADGNWTAKNDGKCLGSFQFTSSARGAKLTVELAKVYPRFCVYYTTASGGGTFSVTTIGHDPTTVDTNREQTAFARTEYLEGPDTFTRKITIEVTSDGQPVTITGMGYYDGPSDVVVNNYAHSGLKLVEMDDSVIDFMCQAGVVVFALGYNDSHSSANRAEFTHKIDRVIAGVKKQGCTLFVNDLCWGLAEGNFYRKEIRRLADEASGIYVDSAALYGDELMAEIKDGAHPTAKGHAMIAEAFLERFQLKH